VFFCNWFRFDWLTKSFFRSQSFCSRLWSARSLCKLSAAGQIVSLLLANAALPAEYFVSNAAEIAAAAKSAKPGDFIIMRDGVWPNADIRFEAQGVPEAPITLQAQTPGKMILTGQSRLAQVRQSEKCLT